MFDFILKGLASSTVPTLLFLLLWAKVHALEKQVRNNHDFLVTLIGRNPHGKETGPS